MGEERTQLVASFPFIERQSLFVYQVINHMDYNLLQVSVLLSLALFE